MAAAGAAAGEVTGNHTHMHMASGGTKSAGSSIKSKKSFEMRTSAKKVTSQRRKTSATRTSGTRKNAGSGTRKQHADSVGNSNEEATEQTPFEKMFVDMLKDANWAEQHLVKGLQTMCDAATTRELRDAFEDHLYLTKQHVSRLQKVFNLLGLSAMTKKCDAMEGIVKEAEEMIKSTPEGSMTRDAALIIAAQKAEHYEIAAYGSLVQVALTLGHDDAAQILEQTLRDEERTDSQLTLIAETYINPMADEEAAEVEEVAAEEYAEME